MNKPARIGVAHLSVFAVVLAVFACYLFSGFFHKYIGIKMLALVSFVPVISAMIIYAVSSLRKGEASIISGRNNIPFIYIAIAMLLAYLPFLTQPFLFGDDLFFFKGGANNNLGSFLEYFRCLASIPYSLFSGIYWGNSNIARCITFGVAVLLAWFLYHWMLKVSKKRLTPFIVTLVMVVSLPMADILGFLAVFPMLFGLLFSVFSVGLLWETVENPNITKPHKIGLAIVAILSAFIGFNCYIIATPIVFVLCATLLCFSSRNKPLGRFVVQYAIVMIIAGVSSYAINIFAYNYYGIEGQASRGQLSFDPSFYAGKVFWFFNTVLPQTIFSIWMSLTGTFVGDRHNLFWGTTLDPVLGGILLFVTFALLAFAFVVWCRRTKRISIAIGLIALVPASFYPFLLLPESNYMSYYAYPLFCLLILYVVLSLRELVLVLQNRFSKNGFYAKESRDVSKHRLIARHGKDPHGERSCRASSVLVAALGILLIVQTGSYAQKSWVNFCDTGYLVAKNAIMSNLGAVESTKRIHVYGSAHPVSISTYPIQLIENVLVDIDYDFGNLEITASTTESYLNGMGYEQWETVMAQAGEEEAKLLEKYYAKDPYYHVDWYTVPQGQDEGVTTEETALLREIFVSCGLIPREGEAVFVDYRMYWQWMSF